MAFEYGLNIISLMNRRKNFEYLFFKFRYFFKPQAMLKAQTSKLPRLPAFWHLQVIGITF
jgi:hypothetical protein